MESFSFLWLARDLSLTTMICLATGLYLNCPVHETILPLHGLSWQRKVGLQAILTPGNTSDSPLVEIDVHSLHIALSVSPSGCCVERYHLAQSGGGRGAVWWWGCILKAYSDCYRLGGQGTTNASTASSLYQRKPTARGHFTHSLTGTLGSHSDCIGLRWLLNVTAQCHAWEYIGHEMLAALWLLLFRTKLGQRSTLTGLTFLRL